MANYKIRCEVIDILKNAFSCTKKGQVFIFGPRTPDGMCAKAFTAIYPQALAMRFSEKMAWEDENGFIEITCPDGDIVYKLSRIKE